mgnify:CR=1 FL=1
MTNKSGTHIWCLSTYKWIPIDATKKAPKNTADGIPYEWPTNLRSKPLTTEELIELSGRNSKQSTQYP